ncbi:DegT/DnrJ/EryC1/StrS family aminotransferase [Actinosynnema sp. NPDC047251]|uniref:Glutamine-scyllo-inositol transaminase n=1 Tax=Saccharothrix espanaensis (strain ATCC 51144 / DSM 44229 / JCM 9112 / NBRC 15066 / NRRL 15764) TaxID=1179773 RepID=K0JW35_SACES|nr:DegT/DnrJ/EryC1/StrS family aminotransferase [Saccharothrix espanaensis]CCH32040.1 Glutamine-scyllo-inositol transaminase [Saccharothrix espanaensis DSM 44229]
MTTALGALAVHGGVPVRTRPFPVATNAAGRTFGREERAAVDAVLADGRLNAVGGTRVAGLEAAMARLHGVAAAVACSSGTAALHMAIGALNPDPGDEVITTPVTDFGTIIAILAQNAVPVFADVDPLTGNLDPDSVRRCLSDRTRAIVAVHLLGAPAPVAELAGFGVPVVEDCAQALLTETPEGLAGTVGAVGCFSLQQYKHITCGDGGLAVTSDPALARALRLFGDKGRPRDSATREHLSFGMNYRMTELQGAVAGVQLQRLPGVVARRRASARRLAAALRDLPGVRLPDQRGHSFWSFPLVVADGNDRWARALRAEGIPAEGRLFERPAYRTAVLESGRIYGGSRFPLSSPPARHDWSYPPGLCPVAERLLGQTLLVLFWNENYTDEDVDDIAAAVRKVHAALT